MTHFFVVGRRNLSFRGLPPTTTSPLSSPVQITGMAGLLKAAMTSSRSSCSSRSSVSSLSHPLRAGSLKAPPEEMALEDGYDYEPTTTTTTSNHGESSNEVAMNDLPDHDEAPAVVAMLPRPARLSSKGRQQSWYREALAQGMSKGDLAALLGDEGDDDYGDDSQGDGLGSGGMARGGGGGEPSRRSSSHLKAPPGAAGAAAAGATIRYSNSLASGGDGGSVSTGGGGTTVIENNLEEEVLEQYRIMAHHEARQRAIARLGYDPAERQQSLKPEAIDAAAAADASTILLALPQLVAPTLSLPPATIAACEPPPIFFSSNHTGNGMRASSFNGKGGATTTTTTKNIFMDSFAPKRRQWMEQHCRRPRELQVGTLVTSTKTTTVAPGQMLVRCLGCRKQLVVGMMATLVSCQDCLTVSPASSTRK